MTVKNFRQSGDTIVEVLIALTVISTVLVSAYTVTRQSLKTVRNSQEQTNALKVAEAQVESLKSLASHPGLANAQLFPTTLNPFCTTRSATAITVVQPSTDPQCTINNGIAYQVTVTRSGSSPNFTFDTVVTWTNINASTSNITMSYNLSRMTP